MMKSKQNASNTLCYGVNPPGLRGYIANATIDLIHIALFFLCLLLLLSACSPSAPAPAGPVTAPKVGSLAPDFTLEKPDGASIRLSELRGAPVFINFWNTSCHYCRYEMANIQMMHDTYSAKGLVVLGIAEKDQPEDVLVYVDRMKLTYSMLLDQDLQVGKMYLVQELPYSYFIDKEGVIQSIYIGELSKVKMEQQVQLIMK